MSAKAPNQTGRRTPLSLSGTVTKGQPNKSNASNVSGNANGHTTSNNNKQDNKLQQQQKTEQQAVINSADIKENPNKKQTEKKQQQQQQTDNKKSGSEKTQNGVNNKQQAIENKEKQQQNGKDEKLNDKDKKEKSEKQDKQEKPEQQDKYEKEETKKKDDTKDQEKSETKKGDKKVKEVKEDKKEAENKNDENKEKDTQFEKSIEETKTKDQPEDKTTASKPEHNDEGKMEVVEQQLQQQKSPPVTPKANTRGSKTSTPSNKTPTKASEKTPQKTVTPSNSAKTTPVVTREVTTAVDADVDMEPLAVEHSPIKSTQLVEATPINITPSASSTPGKIVLPKRNTYAPKSDIELAMQTGPSPERPRAFSQISGRKSIRPITEYTPSKFYSNSQFRESYRRINTELDATNTSLNVTVGSEVPNNSSFSLFFGRGRKRDRTPPQDSRSAIGEIQTDMEISPPKKAKYDMHGFLSAVSSPLSLLRNRFSRATLQSSTPVKLEEKLNSSEDEIEVQNVSGVSVHEEIDKTDKDSENTATNNEDDGTLGVEAEETQAKKDEGTENTPTKQNEVELKDKELKDISLKYEKNCGLEYTSEQSDIKITETLLQPAVGDPMAKNKKCVVM